MADFTLTWQPLAIAITGGLLPALVWLWFWHREDKACPEPRGLVALSFLTGMIIVFFVLPIQKLINAGSVEIASTVNTALNLLGTSGASEDTIKITLWAFAEEMMKYLAVFFIAYKSHYFDEPMDAIVYIITVALGFAAMENSLYILKDLAAGNVVETFLNSNLRLLGATIVHTASSALIGIALAAVFYMHRSIRITAITIGIVGATVLHAYFNLTIMNAQGTVGTLAIFSKIWIAMIGIIVLIEIIKRFAKHNETCAID